MISGKGGRRVVLEEVQAVLQEGGELLREGGRHALLKGTFHTTN